MKATLRMFLTLVAVLTFVANVSATPVTFSTDASGSSVNVNEGAWLGTLKGELVLNPSSFTLADNAIQTIDFFTLTASGLAWNNDYTIEATLAFSDPPIEGEGSGGGKFSTFFGLLSKGSLTWYNMPDYFILADGNKIKIDFESGIAVGFGGKALVHAYVTNMGGAAVPEPATMLLLGLGLAGLAGIRRKLRK